MLTNTPAPPTATLLSCVDPAPVLPIDHVALSLGRPDGLYVAGKQLRPWLTFDERLRMGRLQGERGCSFLKAEDRPVLTALEAASRGESIVVRWSIEGKHASPATVERAPQWGSDNRAECSYTWGGPDAEGKHHVQVCALVHRLIEWALEAMGRGRDSTNPYYDRVKPLVYEMPAEWVLPIASVCKLIAVIDRRAAEDRLAEALALEEKWGGA